MSDAPESTPQAGNFWILGGSLLFLIGVATDAMMTFRGRASQPASWVLMAAGLLAITVGIRRNGASWRVLLTGWLVLAGLVAAAVHVIRG